MPTERAVLDELVRQAVELLDNSGRSDFGVAFLNRRLGTSIGVSQDLIVRMSADGLIRRVGAGTCYQRVAPTSERTVTPDASAGDGRAAPVVAGHPSTEPQPSTEDQAPTVGATVDNVGGWVAIDRIVIDERLQVRRRLTDARVAEYALALENGVTFPPVLLARGRDGVMRLADGFHRVAAHRRAGRASVPATVVDCDAREAYLAGLAANATHGQPLARAERNAAALRLLEDSEWAAWSDQEIGRRSGVSGMTVGRLRRRHLNNGKVSAGTRTCRTPDGSTRRMDVSRLGRPRRKAKAAGGESSSTPDLLETLEHALHGLLRGPEDVRAHLRTDPGARARLVTTLQELLRVVDGACKAA